MRSSLSYAMRSLALRGDTRVREQRSYLARREMPYAPEESRPGLNGRQIVVGLVAGGAVAVLIAFGAPTWLVNALMPIDKTCMEFASQADAEAYFAANGLGDASELDEKSDGRVCAVLP